MDEPRQLTQEEAIKFYKDGSWETMSSKELVNIQLFQRRLCMPFEVFHKAIEEVLGRPVWTHEFANTNSLKEELQGQTPKATMVDVINKLPKNKSIVIVEA